MQWGTGSLVSDMTIRGSLSDGTYQAPIGTREVTAGQSAFTGAVGQRLELDADTDGLYISHTTVCSVRLFDCVITAKYDCVVLEGNAASTVEIFDRSIRAIGPSSASSGATARGVVANAGTIRVHGTSIEARDATTATYGVYTAGGTVELFGCNIDTSSDSGTVYDLRRSAGTLIAAGCEYDRSKTFGTITETSGLDGAIGTSPATDSIMQRIKTLADIVWDEPLTGATHNIATSSGRILRELDELLGYEGGAVWLDTENGIAGDTPGDNGTVDNPTDNITDAITIAVAKGLTRIRVASGSTVTLVAALEGYELFNSNWTLVLNEHSVSGSCITGADVSGICTGALPPKFVACAFGNTTLPPSTVLFSRITGDITAGSAGEFLFDYCSSFVAGVSAPAFDFGAGLNASNLSVRHQSGGIEIKNMGAGTGSYNMSLEGNGQLIINANCSATSTVAIRGSFTVTDNASGAVTLSDDARYDVAQVNAEVVGVLRTDTVAELAAVPAASPGLHAMVQFLYMAERNKLTSTATVSTVANDAGTAIGTSVDSESAGTFTRGKLA